MRKWDPKALGKTEQKGEQSQNPNPDVQAVPVPCNTEKTTQGRGEVFEPLALSGPKRKCINVSRR